MGFAPIQLAKEGRRFGRSYKTPQPRDIDSAVDVGIHLYPWGSKMKEVGLHPSNTGAPGGRETGQQMTHYTVVGGPFERALAEMPKELYLPLEYLPCAVLTSKAKQKTKYQCPVCEARIWGKENLSVRCLDCDHDFETKS